MQSATRLTTLILLGTLASCVAGCSLMDKPAWLATKAANDQEANFYVEVEHEGRIYVIGKPATFATFNTTHELPYRVTYIGAGPKGQSVVIEAEAKELFLQARLRRTYEAKHDTEL